MSGGSFKPGPDPRRNAGGRPKAIIELQELARQHTPAAIEALVAALREPKERVMAATVLLDRAWGKPAQALTGPDGKPLFPRITIAFDADEPTD